jgi:hypothetical protein
LSNDGRQSDIVTHEDSQNYRADRPDKSTYYARKMTAQPCKNPQINTVRNRSPINTSRFGTRTLGHNHFDPSPGEIHRG